MCKWPYQTVPYTLGKNTLAYYAKKAKKSFVQFALGKKRREVISEKEFV